MYKKTQIIIIFIVVVFAYITLRVQAFDDLLFAPLTANHLEARIGSFYQFNSEKLRLDIGHSIDLYEFDFNNSNSLKELKSSIQYNFQGGTRSDNINNNTNLAHNNKLNKLRIGADFFILSRLRSEGRLKFPVETADYFFGINSSCKFKLFEKKISTRLRIAHISSHLIDGYSSKDKFWTSPFIYSREFLDLVFAYENEYMRTYAGCSYIFSTQPKDVKKFVPEFGFDFKRNLYKFLNLYAGYDFKLVGASNLPNVASNSIQAGLSFFISKNIELSLNYYYYSGYSIHGMFYDTKDKYSGLGFQIIY